MPIIPTLQIVSRARQGGYAVAGFEPYNLEQIQAVILAASEEKSPVLLQFWSEVIETWSLETLVAICHSEASRVEIPIGIHLDHATDLDLIDAAIEGGFTSVMFDGSTLPLEDNIRRTAEVVRRAKRRGVCVEAELGLIGHLDPSADPRRIFEEIHLHLTDPVTAARFVQETGVDILAPAVGTIHGCRLPMAKVDVGRIKEISVACGVPLALHGGSGVDEATLRDAIRAGVAKVNIDTEVRSASIASLQREAAVIGASRRPVFEDYARYPRAIRDAAKLAACKRIRAVGASGRA
ncbi:MAG TPA: class II fructose-bisphosphate aldolase [Chthonomonadales bacterium]|nr:class II fructose-bisphosphate aldolase [Chthonomonadales bacterium]